MHLLINNNLGILNVHLVTGSILDPLQILNIPYSIPVRNIQKYYSGADAMYLAYSYTVSGRIMIKMQV